MKLWVVHGQDLSPVVIDTRGEKYSGGLEDFRENNDLLTVGDLASTTGEYEILTVTGHTAWNWRPWIVGGAVVLVGWLAVANFRARRRTDPTGTKTSKAGPRQRSVTARTDWPNLPGTAQTTPGRPPTPVRDCRLVDGERDVGHERDDGDGRGDRDGESFGKSKRFSRS